MSDDFVVVRLRLFRLWALCAAIMSVMFLGFFFAVYLLFFSEISSGNSFILFAYMVAGMCPLFAIFPAVVLQSILSIKISAKGIDHANSWLINLVEWNAMVKLRAHVPCLTKIAGTRTGGFKNNLVGCVVFPAPWLMGNPDEFVAAIEKFSPDGHVLRDYVATFKK